MTFNELLKLATEASFSTGAAAPGIGSNLASGASTLQSLNPVERGKMELPIPGMDNPELTLTDLQDIGFEIAKILDPTGVLSYKDALIASGRMYDEFSKMANHQENHFWLSLLVFVLCVYAALPNVGLLAGGVGGLVQYTGKVGAKIARQQLAKGMTKEASRELGLIARTTEDYFKKNPQQLTSIVDFASKHNLIEPEASTTINNYFLKNPEYMKRVEHMPSLPEYFENPTLLDNTIKAYENRLAGKMDSDKLIRHNELMRKKMEKGLTMPEEKELRNLNKKTELNEYDLRNYEEALYAKNIQKMADQPGPETLPQVASGAMRSQSKFKPEPASSGLSRTAQNIYGKSTGNYYGITGVKGNVITPPSPGMAGIGRGLLTPSQAKVRLGKNIATGWGPMNEPTQGGGTSDVSPTYRPAKQQPGQIPAYNYEMQPIPISAPVSTNLPPVMQPPVRVPAGSKPAGVRFAPLYQRPAAATKEEPFGRYTPGAKDYSTPDNTMQLYGRNKEETDVDNSAGPMPVFQQLSVQKHNDTEQRERTARETRDETKKQIKSFKERMKEQDNK